MKKFVLLMSALIVASVFASRPAASALDIETGTLPISVEWPVIETTEPALPESEPADTTTDDPVTEFETTAPDTVTASPETTFAPETTSPPAAETAAAETTIAADTTTVETTAAETTTAATTAVETTTAATTPADTTTAAPPSETTVPETVLEPRVTTEAFVTDSAPQIVLNNGETKGDTVTVSANPPETLRASAGAQTAETKAPTPAATAAETEEADTTEETEESSETESAQQSAPEQSETALPLETESETTVYGSEDSNPALNATSLTVIGAGAALITLLLTLSRYVKVK